MHTRTIKQYLYLSVFLMTFLLAGARFANAVLIDFDDVTHPTVLNNVYDAMGVNFSGVSGADVESWTTTAASIYPAGYSPLAGSDSNMAVNNTDQSGIRMDFSVDVTSLSLYGVDYGGSDFEVATLSAFDSLGTLLATTTVSSTRDSRIVEGVTMPVDVAFLSLDTSALASIAYAEFTYTGGSFFGIDNVEFTGATAVPEPSTLLLLSMGLVGLAYSRKNTRSNV